MKDGDADDVEVAVIDTRDYALIILVRADGETTVQGNVDRKTVARYLSMLAHAYPLPTEDGKQ